MVREGAAHGQSRGRWSGGRSRAGVERWAGGIDGRQWGYGRANVVALGGLMVVTPPLCCAKAMHLRDEMGSHGLACDVEVAEKPAGRQARDSGEQARLAMARTLMFSYS